MVNEAFKIKNIYIFNILKLFSSNNKLEKQHTKKFTSLSLKGVEILKTNMDDKIYFLDEIDHNLNNIEHTNLLLVSKCVFFRGGNSVNG